MLAQVNGFRASSFERAPQGLVAILKTAYMKKKQGRQGGQNCTADCTAYFVWVPCWCQVILDTINFGSCLSLSVWWEDRGWSFWGQPVYLFISSGPTRSYQGTLSTGTRCSTQAWSQRQRGMCNSNYYYHTGLVVIHADGSSLWILQFRHHPAGVSQLSKASSYLRKVAIRLLGLNHNDQL